MKVGDHVRVIVKGPYQGQIVTIIEEPKPVLCDGYRWFIVETNDGKKLQGPEGWLAELD